MVSSFLGTLVLAVFKKFLVHEAASGLAALAVKAVHVYSAFEISRAVVGCVEAVSDCEDLRVCGHRFVSTTLPDSAIEKLVSIGYDHLCVEQRDSGVFIASRLVPEFQLADVRVPTLTVPSIRETTLRAVVINPLWAVTNVPNPVLRAERLRNPRLRRP